MITPTPHSRLRLKSFAGYVFALTIATIAPAQIVFNFSENGDGNVQIDISGTISVAMVDAGASHTDNNYSFTNATFSDFSFYSTTTYDLINTNSSTSTSIPWSGSFAVLSTSGDDFGYTPGYFFVPSDFSESRSISATWILNTTLDSLNLSSGGANLIYSATTPNLVTYTVTTSAVPEPSTYAAILGIIALGGAAIRRQRLVPSLARERLSDEG